jgi:hypothetical protein
MMDLQVPAVPVDEIKSDAEYLAQVAEWIVAMVRLGDCYDGTVKTGKRGRAPVEDHVSDFLNALYTEIRKNYEDKG